MLHLFWKVYRSYILNYASTEGDEWREREVENPTAELIRNGPQNVVHPGEGGLTSFDPALNENLGTK